MGFLPWLCVLLFASVDYYCYSKGGWTGKYTASGLMNRIGTKWPLFIGLTGFAMGCGFWHFFGS